MPAPGALVKAAVQPCGSGSEVLRLGSVRGVTAVAACAALSASGCFAVADLDRFTPTDAGVSQEDDKTKPSDLLLTMRGMKPHLDQLIEFRVIDTSNFIQSRGVIEPVDEPSTFEVTFHVPKAIPAENGPYRFDFYADVSGSRSFEGLAPEGLDPLFRDHAWRIDPLADYPEGAFPHVANSVQVIFTHNKLFTDINEWEGKPNPPKDTGADVRVRFSASKMAEFTGKLLQVRVSEVNSGHVVALYRNPEIPSTDFEGRIPGAVELGDAYLVDVYIDANGNGTYESPTSVQAGVDRVWRFPMNAATVGSGGAGGSEGAGGAGGAGGSGGGEGGAGGATESVLGIDLDFDPSVPSVPVDIGPP